MMGHGDHLSQLLGDCPPRRQDACSANSGGIVLVVNRFLEESSFRGDHDTSSNKVRKHRVTSGVSRTFASFCESSSFDCLSVACLSSRQTFGELVFRSILFCFFFCFVWLAARGVFVYSVYPAPPKRHYGGTVVKIHVHYARNTLCTSPQECKD